MSTKRLSVGTLAVCALLAAAVASRAASDMRHSEPAVGFVARRHIITGSVQVGRERFAPFGFHIVVSRGGGVSANGIWHVETAGCAAFVWVDVGNEPSAGVCLRTGQRVAPTVRCESDNIVVEAQPVSDAKEVRLMLSNGAVLAAPIISVPVMGSTSLAYYYQRVPRRGATPEALTEIIGQDESSGAIRLPAMIGCDRHGARGQTAFQAGAHRGSRVP